MVHHVRGLQLECSPASRHVVQLTSLRAFQPLAPTSCPHRQPRRQIVAGAAHFNSGGAELASEFSSHVNKLGLGSIQRQRAPSPLLPPTAALSAVLDALQRCDWPEADAGLKVAFRFSQPAPEEGSGLPGMVRPWAGRQPSVDWQGFKALLLSPPFDVLLDCESWRPLSELAFPSRRFDNKAIQVVQVTAGRRGTSASSSSSSSSIPDPSTSPSDLRPYTFTFCLERSDSPGSLRGCWLVVGCRAGNYSA